MDGFEVKPIKMKRSESKQKKKCERKSANWELYIHKHQRVKQK